MRRSEPAGPWLIVGIVRRRIISCGGLGRLFVVPTPTIWEFPSEVSMKWSKETARLPKEPRLNIVVSADGISAAIKGTRLN